jgi:hypothetical protein
VDVAQVAWSGTADWPGTADWSGTAEGQATTTCMSGHTASHVTPAARLTGQL